MLVASTIRLVASDAKSDDTTTSVGSSTVVPSFSLLPNDLPCPLDKLVLDEGIADIESLRLKEGGGHSTAHDERLGASGESLYDRELVRDFGPANDCHEWMLG